MKKVLLSAALACMALAGYAQGIPAVGANIVVLPSTQWSKAAWTAQTLVVNSYSDYGSWEPGYHDERFAEDEARYGTGNYNYNVLTYGEGAFIEDDSFLQDEKGNMWYEPAYDGSKVKIMNDMFYDDENPDSIVYIKWEEHQAPFSSDAVYHDMPSYQWCAQSQMADLFIRRTFTTDKLLSGDVYLACGHDDAPAEFYINGVLVFERTGFELNGDGSIRNGWNNDEVVKLTDEQKALIKLGGEENLIAIHVHQNWGGAFADCGLYTLVEGGLPMGYVEPWEGKVLFNNHGGYNFDGKTPSNNPKNPWSRLYEAKEGDEYTFTMNGASEEGDIWKEQLHFKTPIRIQSGKDYTFKCKINADADFTGFVVKLTDNDNDEIELAFEDGQYANLAAGEDTEISIDFEGEAKNFKVAFDFGGGKPGATVTIKEMSLQCEGEELWIGTHYFNYFYMTDTELKYYYTEWEEDPNTGETIEKKIYVDADDERVEDVETIFKEIDAPELTGRTETMAWTLPDFDDSMWDEQMMPVGNMGYNPRPQSNWPGNDGNYNYEGDGREGENTNYWIRRTFTLDKVNERLSYALNVCHDDNYETYVNGHLLQQFSGWTNGKNPKQVHIPAKYLNEGKNVIATYIQQNWGGRFYDCGINVEEVNYEECADLLKAAIALGKEEKNLTSAMKKDLAAIVAEGENELANNKDAAEVKEYARVMTENVKKIQGYEADVTVLQQTMEILAKENNGFGGYADKALANAKENYDTCHTADQLNEPFRRELRVARKRNAAERRTEKYTGLALEEMELGTEFYLYNVGARQFLKGTESWGAHAGLGYASNAFTLEEDKEGEFDCDGSKKYRIETHRPNGAEGINDFLNWGGYVDVDTNDGWDFIPVEGKPNVFNIVRYNFQKEGHETNAEGGLFYLGLRDGDNNNVPQFNGFNVVDTDMKTASLETNQWMLITPEEMNSFIATASKEQPADLTHLIVNPCFDQRLPIDYWMREFEGGNCQSEGRGNDRVDLAFEAWNTQSYTLWQEIYDDENLKPGHYSLYVQAYYRDGNYDTEAKNKVEGGDIFRCGHLFASWNEEGEKNATTQIWNISDLANQSPGLGRLDATGTIRMPDACWSASEEYFHMGLYWNRLDFEIPEGEGGFLAIGVYKELLEGMEEFKGGDWLVCDNFRLKYYGADAPDPVAIDAVESEGTPAVKYIYNVAGQRLSKVQKGINIVGGKKYVVK